jgi:hypothetical protein
MNLISTVTVWTVSRHAYIVKRYNQHTTWWNQPKDHRDPHRQYLSNTSCLQDKIWNSPIKTKYEIHIYLTLTIWYVVKLLKLLTKCIHGMFLHVQCLLKFCHDHESSDTTDWLRVNNSYICTKCASFNVGCDFFKTNWNPLW